MAKVDFDALKAAAAGGRSGHSPLYEDMWQEFARLSKIFTPLRRPDWAQVAAAYAKAGAMDGDGKPPSDRVVQKTWWRVKRDKAAIATTASETVASSKKTGAGPKPPLAKPALAQSAPTKSAPARAGRQPARTDNASVAGDPGEPPEPTFAPSSLKKG